MNTNIVLDTNIIISGLRSNKGYFFKILSMLPEKVFTINISVPLVLEYESVLVRNKNEIGFSIDEISEYLDYLCLIGSKTEIYYLWRPILTDPFDDHVLEVAVASQSSYIVTFNKKDFEPAHKFGINIVTPKEYLYLRGEK